MDLPWQNGFEDFGVDPLMPHGPSELVRLTQAGNATLKDLVSRFSPRMPGVYGMLDATDRLIYVGKSKMLRSRLLSYFMPNNSDEKAGRIVECASKIVIEQQPSEFSALVREQALIRRWQPRFNVVGMPRRQQTAFICLGNGSAEQIFVSKWMDQSASVCRGPFHGASNLHRAVEILNRMYRLRDCSPRTPMMMSNQLQLFEIDGRAGCVRYEIGNCLAPCQSSCSRDEYLHQTELAKRFLDGDATEVLEQLEQSMNRAAAGRHFEHAARLRDDLRIVRWLSSRLAIHRRARESHPFLYCVTGCDGRDVWYLIRHGGIEHAIAAPSDSIQWRRVRAAIDRWLERGDSVGSGCLKSEDTLGLVSAWFQKQKQESLYTLPIANLPLKWSELKKLLHAPQFTQVQQHV